MFFISIKYGHALIYIPDLNSRKKKEKKIAVACNVKIFCMEFQSLCIVVMSHLLLSCMFFVLFEAFPVHLL